MSELLIFNKDDSLLTILSNEAEGACPFWDAPFKETLNNGSTFEFAVPADHEDAKFIVAENQVAFLDKDNNFRLFVIKEPEKNNSANGPVIRSVCEPAMLELTDEVITDVRAYNASLQTALTRALQGTRWKVGQTADFGINSTNYYYINVVEAIQKVINTWGGELRDRVEIDENKITGRYIDILPRRGADTGKLWEIDKDILTISHKVQSYPKTALYGRGSSLEVQDGDGNATGGFTRKITFSEVEWKVANGDPVDKPYGQEWVGDPSALSVYGRKNDDGSLRHRFGFYDNSEQKDPATLLKETWDSLQQQKHPIENYSMDVFLLEEVTGYEHEKVRLGDTTFAIDRSFAEPIEVEERVIVYEYDVADPDNTGRVELGQYIDLYLDDDRLDKIEAKLNDKSGIWDLGGGPVTDEKIENVTPGKVTGVIVSGAVKTIILEWDFVNIISIANYEVFASQIKGFAPDKSNLVFRGKTSGYDFKANTDELWYFRVRAINTHGVAGAYSDEVSASTVRIISDDILFGPDVAKELEELSKVAETLSKEAKDKIVVPAFEYTDGKVAVEEAARQLEISTAKTEVLTAAEAEAKRKADAAQAEAIRQAAIDAQNKVNAAKTALESDIAKKVDATWVNGQLVLKADKSSTYTKNEVDNALNSKVSSLTYTTDQQGVVQRLNSAESRISQTEQGLLSTVQKTIYEQDKGALIDEIKKSGSAGTHIIAKTHTPLVNGSYLLSSRWGITIEVKSTVHVGFCKVYGNSTPQTFRVRLLKNDVVIETRDYDIIPGENRINLDFLLAPGIYIIDGLPSAGMWRNNSNASYPYESGDFVITGVSNGTIIQYYYFYDIEISGAGVKGEISPNFTVGGEQLETRIKKAETLINQTATDIALKANKTDVYTKAETGNLLNIVEQRISNAESQLNIQADEIATSVKKVEFDYFKFGGLIEKYTSDRVRKSGSIAELNDYNAVLNSTGRLNFEFWDGYELEPNTDYIAKIHGDFKDAQWGVFFNRGNYVLLSYRTDRELYFNTGTRTDFIIVVKSMVNNNRIGFATLEKAGVMSDVRQRLSTAESSITQQAGQILSKVEKTDYTGNAVASLINQTATTIKLQASKIELDGDVSIVNGFTKIANLAVGNAQIAAGAITNAKIANLSVTTAKIANLAVTSAEIADAAITSAKIGSAAVGTAAIANGAITRAKIETAAIGTAQIENASITNSLIASNANIDAAKIGDISATKIKTGTLTGIDIQSPTTAGGLIRLNNGVISNSWGNSQIRMTTLSRYGAQQSLMQFDEYSTGAKAEIMLAGQGLELWANNNPIVLSAHTYLNSGYVLGDFSVSGTKNAAVPTSIGMVNVSAYETAEYYFGDIGRGVVANGECVIEIESLFKETVNTNIDYEVFLTPYGKGLIYVDEMTTNSFTVKGDNILFAYEIKAKRKGYEDVRLEATEEIEVESIAHQNAS